MDLRSDYQGMTSQEMPHARSRSVELNDGARVYVEEFGDGDPLVLLHGGLGTGRDWLPLIPNLTAEFHVVTLDVRGHGHSTNPASSLTYPLIASDVVEVIEQLELDRPFIAGWSDGGQHVLQVGARFPNVARALAAGAADYQSTAETRRWVRAFFGMDEVGEVDLEVLDQELGDAAERFRAKHPGGHEQWRSLVEQTARLWLDGGELSAEEYARIDVPTLVVLGDRDADLPVEDAVSMYRAIPHAELAICPGADHFIPWARPDWLVVTLTEFFSRHRG